MRRFQKAGSKNFCFMVFVMLLCIDNTLSFFDELTTPSPEEFKQRGLFFWLNPRNYIKFYLWTSKRFLEPEVLKLNDKSSLLRSNFNSSNPLKILIHGYGDNGIRTQSMIMLKAAYISTTEDINVITMDYPGLVPMPMYLLSATNTDLAAEELAKFLDFLSFVYPLEKVHVIGFSLGAHVAGMAGQFVTKGKIGRITALDPAGPSFQFAPENQRISKTDAMFIDVIHTGASLAVTRGFGFVDPVGHVDFYPNGGRDQPGCEAKMDEDLPKIYCEHTRAVFLFVESLLYPSSLVGCKCASMRKYKSGRCPCTENDLVYIGDSLSPKTQPGLYFLTTGRQFPYGYGMKIFPKEPERLNQTLNIIK